jgi:hypothetical protein
MLENMEHANRPQTSLNVAKSQKHAGRPATAPKEQKKATLGIRASPDLKRRLLAAGDHNDRSLSAEAEIRLESTFADQDALTRALRLAWRGRPNSGVAALLGETLSAATRWSETLGEGDWHEDGDAFAAVEATMLEILERLRPKHWGSRDEERVRDYRRHARLPLLSIELELTGKRREGQKCPDWLATLIGELGPLAPRLVPTEPPPPVEEPATTPRRRRAA